jgi:hypothetical protein
MAPLLLRILPFIIKEDDSVYQPLLIFGDISFLKKSGSHHGPEDCDKSKRIPS